MEEDEAEQWRRTKQSSGGGQGKAVEEKEDRAVEEDEYRLKVTLGMHFVFEFVVPRSVRTLDLFLYMNSVLDTMFV